MAIFASYFAWVSLKVVSLKVVSLKVVSLKVVSPKVVSLKVVSLKVVSLKVASLKVVSLKVVSLKVVSLKVVSLKVVGVGVIIMTVSDDNHFESVQWKGFCTSTSRPCSVSTPLCFSPIFAHSLWTRSLSWPV